MGSRVTVTDSAFEGGRDGIYLHRADGSVVRNSTFTDNRYGTHLMYTGDALIADNAFRNELFGGITVMTRPSGNAIVGNDVRNSSAGCRRLVPGRTSGTTRSSATNSASRPARAGRCTSATWPRTTSWAHERPRSSRRAGSSRTTSSATRTTRPPGRGALRLGRRRPRELLGGANVGVHEPGERAYRPTAPVDAALHREVAAVAVRESPAVALLDRLRGPFPGALGEHHRSGAGGGAVLAGPDRRRARPGRGTGPCRLARRTGRR